MQSHLIQFEGMFVFIFQSIVGTLLLKWHNKQEMYYFHVSSMFTDYQGVELFSMAKRLHFVSKSLTSTENNKILFNLFKRLLVKKTKLTVEAGGKENRKHDGIKQHWSIWTLAAPRPRVGRQPIAGHLCNLFWIQCLHRLQPGTYLRNTCLRGGLERDEVFLKDPHAAAH